MREEKGNEAWRLALLRAVLAAGCMAAQLASLPRASFTGSVFAACFFIYSLVLLTLARRIRRERTDRLLLLITDTVLYLGWVSLAAPGAIWLAPVFYFFLLTVAVMEQGWRETVVVVGAVTLYHLIVIPPGTERLWPGLLAIGLLGLVFAYQHAVLLARIKRAEQIGRAHV